MDRRIYYHYRDLEEHAHGMWRRTPSEEHGAYIESAAGLMADPQAFLDAMRRASIEWPKSMEAAMSTSSLNQRAYMGHAGCCIALGCPEDLTRLAWHTLTQEQQDEANRMADIAIAEYGERRAIEKGWLW
jgi:hypothetical protein